VLQPLITEAKVRKSISGKGCLKFPLEVRLESFKDEKKDPNNTIFSDFSEKVSIFFENFSMIKYS
jgi:hypothetical protein